MEDMWDVWFLPDEKKIIITNMGGVLVNAELIAVNVPYSKALAVAKRKAEKTGAKIEEYDEFYCPVCDCYAGFHSDGTECNCDCCCGIDFEEEWEGYWECMEND